MLLFQVISILFAVFMMYVIRIHQRKGHFDNFEFGVWVAVWLGFIFLTIFPQTIAGVAERLHIGRVFDAIVILAFMVVSTVVFINRIDIKKLEKKLEDKVRQQAIQQAKKG